MMGGLMFIVLRSIMPTSKQKSSRNNYNFYALAAVVFLIICIISFSGWYVVNAGSSMHTNSESALAKETSQLLKQNGAFVFPQAISVSDVSFTNEEGNVVGKQHNIGKWSFLFFGYTFCPDVCPTTLAIMQQMWKNLDSNTKETTQIVLVSVDIERDTPEQLKSYMDYFDPNFTAFTGNAKSLKSLTSQLNAVYAKVERVNADGETDPNLGYLMDHSANIAILDPNGDYYGFIQPPFNSKKLLVIVNALHAAQSPSK